MNYKIREYFRQLFLDAAGLKDGHGLKLEKNLATLFKFKDGSLFKFKDGSVIKRKAHLPPVKLEYSIFCLMKAVVLFKVSLPSR